MNLKVQPRMIERVAWERIANYPTVSRSISEYGLAINVAT